MEGVDSIGGNSIASAAEFPLATGGAVTTQRKKTGWGRGEEPETDTELGAVGGYVGMVKGGVPKVRRKKQNNRFGCFLGAVGGGG